MAAIDWMIKGPEVSTCNCDWGCPCQFNALPTHGHCRAGAAMRIDEGYFGDVPLDGLVWIGMFAWPEAIHEGNGEGLAVIDENASDAQFDALMAIMSGDTSEPGATMFSVFASTLTTMHPPLRAPITFQVDYDNWTGHFSVPDLIDADASPIANPITGETHRARVTLPEGFEYREAEFVSSRTRATGPVPLDWQGGHAHIAILHMTQSGPVG